MSTSVERSVNESVGDLVIQEPSAKRLKVQHHTYSPRKEHILASTQLSMDLNGPQIILAYNWATMYPNLPVGSFMALIHESWH